MILFTLILCQATVIKFLQIIGREQMKFHLMKLWGCGLQTLGRRDRQITVNLAKKWLLPHQGLSYNQIIQVPYSHRRNLQMQINTS